MKRVNVSAPKFVKFASKPRFGKPCNLTIKKVSRSLHIADRSNRSLSKYSFKIDNLIVAGNLFNFSRRFSIGHQNQHFKLFNGEKQIRNLYTVGQNNATELDKKIDKQIDEKIVIHVDNNFEKYFNNIGDEQFKKYFGEKFEIRFSDKTYNGEKNTDNKKNTNVPPNIEKNNSIEKTTDEKSIDPVVDTILGIMVAGLVLPFIICFVGSFPIIVWMIWDTFVLGLIDCYRRLFGW